MECGNHYRGRQDKVHVGQDLEPSCVLKGKVSFLQMCFFRSMVALGRGAMQLDTLAFM